MSPQRVTFAPADVPHILVRAATADLNVKSATTEVSFEHAKPSTTAHDQAREGDKTAVVTILSTPLPHSDESGDETDNASLDSSRPDDFDQSSSSWEDILGLRSQNHDPEAHAATAAVEDDDAHSNILVDVQLSTDARPNSPPHPAIQSLRTPGIDQSDTDHIRSQTSPVPSEAVITDRGEGDWNASDLKHQIQASTSGLASGDSPEAEDSFADLLVNAMVRPARCDTRFLPRGKLEKLVNVATVERELNLWKARTGSGDVKGRSMHSWAEQICGKHDSSGGVESERSEEDMPKKRQTTHRKIFAILQTSMLPPETIFELLEERISDADLPLRPLDESAPFKVRRRKYEGSPVQCLRSWGPTKIKAFCNEQWAMVSPFFARGDHNGVQHYRLEPQDILPFTEDSRDKLVEGQKSGVLQSGGFGEVFKVRIHPDHHNFHDDLRQSKELNFAVKRLYSTKEEDWKKEIEILKRFSSDPHRHLISLLATYVHKGSVHLLFHWADADLQEYWRSRRPKPSMDGRMVCWIARQCLGIASGIEKIHSSSTNKAARPGNVPANSEMAAEDSTRNDRLYGRHGDIKPRNILWFKDTLDEDGMGTLVITDFGVAEMNSKHSRSRKSNRDIAFSRTYCAPEAHISGWEIRRSYDIWTLGCLYLEFLTWLLGGWQLVAKFARDRAKPEKAFPKEKEVNFDWFFELELEPSGLIVGARVKGEVTSVSSFPIFSEYLCSVS
jgi:hypothetical protein